VSLLRKGTITRRGGIPYIFFDHFPGNTLNLNKWVLREGTVTVSDSQLILTGTTGTRGRIDGIKQFNPQTIISAYSRCSSVADYLQLISVRDGPAFNNSIILYFWAGWWRFRTETPDGAYEVVNVPLSSPTQFHLYKIVWESTPKATLYQDNVKKAESTYRVPTVPLVCYYRESPTLGGDVYVDWVSVRKI
jgi:hypothetical protein